MLILRLLISLSLAWTLFAAPLEHASFIPPYAEVDSAGDRIVNKHWRISGTTEVQKSFIRITPDRQSKRGSVWSRAKIGENNLSALVKFRISGQGKAFYGDGIGVWFSDSAFWSEGELHGGQENFTGVAIIFDTFKNTESLSSHRDVSVLVNDGKKNYELMKQSIQGCNTNPSVRYHSERADFQVTDASRANIVFRGHTLTIRIDAKNSGEWVDCVSFELPSELPTGFLANSYMGITASTGQLADNHDVISVQTDSDYRGGDELVANEKKIAEAGKSSAGIKENLYPEIPNSNSEARTLRLEETIRTLLSRLQTLELEAEHSRVASEEKISNIIGKLSKREDNSERRIDLIEQVVREKIAEHFDTHLEGRLADHADSLRADMEETVGNMANQLDEHVADLKTQGQQNTQAASKLKEKISEISQGGAGWKMPVYFLLFLIVGLAVAGFVAYQRLWKSWSKFSLD